MSTTPQAGARNRRLRMAIGLVLLVALLLQCQTALNTQSKEASPTVAVVPPRPGPSEAVASVALDEPISGETDPIEAKARRDPIAFFEDMIDRYDRRVRDYTCVFTKQELLGGALTERQVIKAMYREEPFSVRLEWLENADKAARVLYVKDRWVDEGRQMAVVDPAGAIASFLVDYVMRPIHGADARKSSRRTIDQFGVRNSMVLTLKYAKLGVEQGVGTFEYMGRGEVSGRETLVFERHLPYTGDDGAWPDGLLVVHIDRDLLLPTLCECYTNDTRQTLLGLYQWTDLDINPNLPDSVFTKEGMGL